MITEDNTGHWKEIATRNVATAKRLAMHIRYLLVRRRKQEGRNGPQRDGPSRIEEGGITKYAMLKTTPPFDDGCGAPNINYSSCRISPYRNTYHTVPRIVATPASHRQTGHSSSHNCIDLFEIIVFPRVSSRSVSNSHTHIVVQSA